MSLARTQVLERLFRKLDRYGPPSAEEYAGLAEIMSEPRDLAQGEVLIQQFAPPRGSTLLISGLMGRVVSLRSGAQQITALHIPGDFVDLHAFVLARMDHSVVALTPCTVATAPHADLKRLTDRYPRLARALWYLTMVDASIHRHWLAVLGLRGAMGRLAHLLCELYVRLEDVGLAEAGAFDLALTQADAAEVLGLSAVHVNRVAQELRRRGVMTWNRRRIEIKDWAMLVQLADFDPTYLQLESQIET